MFQPRPDNDVQRKTVPFFQKQPYAILRWFIYNAGNLLKFCCRASGEYVFHFLAKWKNGHFSIIRFRTGSVLILGHFFGDQDEPTKFHWSRTKIRGMLQNISSSFHLTHAALFRDHTTHSRSKETKTQQRPEHPCFLLITRLFVVFLMLGITFLGFFMLRITFHGFWCWEEKLFLVFDVEKKTFFGSVSQNQVSPFPGISLAADAFLDAVSPLYFAFTMST